MANHSVEAQIAAGEAAASQPLLHDKKEEESGAGTGYVGRLKVAVLDCVDTATRAPETLEEALAVIKGERAVKPDYGRAVSTVSAVRWPRLKSCFLLRLSLGFLGRMVIYPTREEGGGGADQWMSGRRSVLPSFAYFLTYSSP